MEAGGYDCEDSVTLPLEYNYNWTGTVLQYGSIQGPGFTKLIRISLTDMFLLYMVASHRFITIFEVV